ncbi:hypothetical protein K488DRAFT_39334, partial [Vararia minispora EC-137]
MSVRPFSPNERFSFPKPPACATITDRSSLITPGASSKGQCNPFIDPNVPSPSIIPASSITAGTHAMVQRPFMPTLPDELMVILGESVLVLQAFDDGWVQVRNGRKTVGLIPLDCFREKDEDVPAFLASKRVSSFF